MAGKTTWSARDAAHHDRELVVELVEEFGPAGGYVDTVMRDLAQQQRDAGRVLTGFRSVAKKCGITPEVCRAIVERAAEIGQFDDLEIDGDGRRFTLRVSGWEADQQRAGAAWKKARQRSGDKGGTGGGQVPRESPSGSPTRPNLTIEPLENPSVGRLCDLLCDLIEGNGSNRPTISKAWQDAARLMLEKDGRREEDVEAVIRWCQADTFWQTNVLSMPKLREKFDQLRLKMDKAVTSAARRPGNHVGPGPSGLGDELQRWERWCAANGVTHPHGPRIAWQVSRRGDKTVTVEKVTAMLPRLTAAEAAA